MYSSTVGVLGILFISGTIISSLSVSGASPFSCSDDFSCGFSRFRGLLLLSRRFDFDSVPRSSSPSLIRPRMFGHITGLIGLWQSDFPLPIVPADENPYHFQDYHGHVQVLPRHQGSKPHYVALAAFVFPFAYF